MTNIYKLSELSNNSSFTSPQDALNDAIQSLGKEGEGAFTKGKKLLILCLDDTEGNFSVSFINSQLKASQCVSLCEVAKTIFLTDMGYLPKQ